MRTVVACAAFAAIWVLQGTARAENEASDQEGGGEASFEAALKKSDPAKHREFVALKKACAKGLSRLQDLRERMKTATGDARAALDREFAESRRKYLQAYVAYVDFLDAHDRKAIETYERAIARLREGMAARKKARAEVEKALAEK